MKLLFRAGAFSILLSAISYLNADAQFSIGAQLRTRTEYRDGQGAPLPQGSNPAVFTSQRTRLMAGFTGYRFKLGATIQDVRVWGQDVSMINRTTTQDLNGLMVHEAWAEVMLLDTVYKNKILNLKVGRQEIAYDDMRLLGNLDWLQQGRRHDAAILKYETGPFQLHLGGGFNQNKENTSGTIYNETPPGNYTATTNAGTMYKGMEFLYAGKKFKKGNMSFLFFADQFSRYHTDTVNGVATKVYEQATQTRLTTGLFYTNTFDRWTVSASGYYQFGHGATGLKLSAATLNANFMYQLTKPFSAGAGLDFATGGTSSDGKTSNAFDFLYGTPHKYWGYMDYFYVGSPFGNRGLQDYYLKTKFKPNTKWTLTGDIHEFLASSEIPGYDTRRFGEELDIVGNLALTKVVSFEAGYSHFWSTNALTSAGVKNVANAKSNSNWAYLMIIIKPDFIFK
ncbi:alginate export family protein [Chitinophaga sancti]|uniref:alginate export family protein n=1 Tax=Chitinophaga sancti TaxID=1004 RepID=UPI003F791021